MRQSFTPGFTPGRAPLWAALTLALAIPAVSSATALESFIVQCAPKCDAVAAAVRQIPGARVDQVYKNVPGLAVTLPVSAVPVLQARSDVAGMTKDTTVSLPPTDLMQELPAADSFQVIEAASLPGFIDTMPADYDFNNDLIGATALHDEGYLGTNVVVAIIDSGTANSPTVPALAGSVIGGENFVVGDPVPSATSRLNGNHGTWVGTAVAAHAIFLFNNTSVLIQSLQEHAPDSVIPCSELGCPPTQSGVAMIGSAPGAKLYALKVFPFNSISTTTARILAAMDRAITLRRNFNNGVPSVVTNPGCGDENNPCVYDSLPIQVVNMSLGGVTLFAGRDLEDQLTLEMIKEGITVVVSAGNDGPAALTTGSPGTGYASLTVAAAATAAHERVLRDIQFGLGIGSLWRPFSGLQSATFSSRGPLPTAASASPSRPTAWQLSPNRTTAESRWSPARRSRLPSSPAPPPSCVKSTPPPRRSRSATPSPRPATPTPLPTARARSTAAAACSTFPPPRPGSLPATSARRFPWA